MKSSTRSGGPADSATGSGTPSPIPGSSNDGTSDLQRQVFTGRKEPLIRSKSRLLHLLLEPGGKPPPPELAASWGYASRSRKTPTRK